MAPLSLLGVMPMLALMLLYARSDPDAAMMEKGKSHLKQLQDFARNVRYGKCWSNALKTVDVGCKELTEEQQSRIALTFTHCHLKRSNRSYPKCTDTSSILECTHGMDYVAFNTYTEFFTHAHSICYYLQHEMWQEQAQDTILRLTAHSDSVARQLETTNQMAEEMMKAQNSTLQTQEEILQNGHLLKHTLKESTLGMKQAFQEMEQSATEQRLLFSEIFNRITFLHQFVVGESNSLYSFLYNLIACAAVFLLTSTQRTSGARLVLFGLIAANIYTERMICSYILGGSDSAFDQTERIAFWVGIARRINTSLGLLVLLYFTLTHRDVQRQSLEVLQGLQETKAELQTVLREAENLLSKPKLAGDAALLKGVSLFGDSGIPDPSFLLDRTKENTMLNSRYGEMLAMQITSTPKKRSCSRSRSRSRSASRRKTTRPSEPAVYKIAVTQPGGARTPRSRSRSQSRSTQRRGRSRSRSASRRKSTLPPEPAASTIGVAQPGATGRTRSCTKR
uniref:Protein brambleberry-like n=1 Tax=Leptobrachium leishanense TaxID=445787 RepID=A0A8C5QXN5_9ANUR